MEKIYLKSVKEHLYAAQTPEEAGAIYIEATKVLGSKLSPGTRRKWQKVIYQKLLQSANGILIPTVETRKRLGL